VKFQDDVRWAEQQRELTVDETGIKFFEILTAWFTRAEELYAEHDEYTTPDGIARRTRRRTLMQAVRQALADVETDKGYISMEWIGQMMLIALQHWTHGPDMEHAMTRLERRMVEQMAAIKMADLQSSAAGSATL